MVDQSPGAPPRADTPGPTRSEIEAGLRTILDPEMPINLMDLGIIADIRISGASAAAVEIDVTPTFIGCPALDMIRTLIEQRISGLPDVGSVGVRFVNDPPWSVARISPAGREALRLHGVTTPHVGGTGADLPSGLPLVPLSVPTPRGAAVRCPFCGSAQTRMESAFGPTRCRMIYYCDACRNGFEHLKSI